MNLPFRWDLVTPDQLGSLLDDVVEPDTWYLAELAECAGRVLARSGNGDLVFVGRSLDSMFDLLGGALEGTSRVLHRLPVSFDRSREIAHADVPRARELAAEIGITPAALARRDRPVTFVDVVWAGGTFGKLFGLLDDWIAEERETWPAIRRKLRFVGVTSRTATSPNVRRWQQDADWTRRLPAASVLNVSLDPQVWDYLGNDQIKLTWPYQLHRWREYLREAKRDEHTRMALAEAVRLVELGRTKEVRRMIARAMDGEPALTEPWLRTLRSQLN
ncbi:hypothetical protein SAMN04488074_12329 [Lentzea albidocapillata subsp. violacea]|uniref:Uncharacterized protein n=1 Tax=Lentzea albidocapillata subsp. violacea TaxID=128104 RepID=A0A1G9U3E2_9PSEU|nr:hypothetical protein [Lentzea albidocapillata]SDM54184.1 hypothetical protein SAMN04488074_12329 [Lentzea albidocapillata subsp. violacea]